jgi:hypothetical protein
MSELRPVHDFTFNMPTDVNCTISTTSLLAEYANVKRSTKSETVTWLNKHAPEEYIKIRKITINKKEHIYQIYHQNNWHYLEKVGGYRFITFEICGFTPCTYVRFYER